MAKTFNEALASTGVILTKTRRRHPRRRRPVRPGCHRQAHQVRRAPAKSWRTSSRSIPERMASRILGMGDVLSLIEKAPEQVQSEKEAEDARQASLMENKFDMNDLLDQFRQIQKDGRSFRLLLAMMPGGNQTAGRWMLWTKRPLPRIEAIIYSMTPEERAKPSIINPKPQAPHRRGLRH